MQTLINERMIVKEKIGEEKYLNFQIEENGIYNADCLFNYKQCGFHSVDLILTDLPYGTTACSWDSILPFDKLWEMVDYVLKPNGTFLTTASQPFTSALIMSNPKMFKYEIIWHKSRKTGHVHAKNKPMKEHENILVFSKGTTVHKSQSNNRMKYNPQGLIEKKNKINYRPSRELKGSNVVAGHRPSHKNTLISEYTNYPTSIQFFNSEHNVGAIHPTQKPLALFEWLLKTYSDKGDMIFDPTAGSGTTAIACEKLERDYICFENDIEMCNKANERLNAFEKSKERGLFSFTDEPDKAE